MAATYIQLSNRLYCKRQGAGADYCVAVRDNKLILTLPNDNDPTQLWYKDGSNATGFMLLNKAAGKAVQHSAVGDQLVLVNKPIVTDQSVLWTESEDVGDGFTFIRTQGDVGLVMDAFYGSVFDGTIVSIYPNAHSDNEYWKLTPYAPPTQKLYCKRQGPGGDYCVAVRDGKLVLALPDDNDSSQVWHKDSYATGFVLVNKATGKPVQYSGVGNQLQLVNTVPKNTDQSILWTDSEDVGDGYTFIRTQGDVGLVMDALYGYVFDGTLVSIFPNAHSDNEHWKLTPYTPPTQKLYCKRQGPGGDYCVAVRDGKLVLALPDDKDTTQVWYKDSYETGFVLVNKATRKPVHYSGVGDQLQLVNTVPNNTDQSILWTTSEDVGNGYAFIRTLSNVGIVMDAWEGHIFDGTKVSIYQNAHSDNEYWKLVSYAPPTHRLYCKRQGPEGDYCVTVKDNKLILTLPKVSDPSQLWYKDSYDNGFMLVNKATNKPVQYNGVGDQLQLVNKFNGPDQSVLWTESEDVGGGYTFLRTQSNVGVVMDAHNGYIFDGTLVSIYANVNSDNEYWKLAA